MLKALKHNYIPTKKKKGGGDLKIHSQTYTYTNSNSQTPMSHQTQLA